MATYTVYNYATPKGSYKDYMPEYKTYSYQRPKDTYSDYDSPYRSDILVAQNKLSQLEDNKPNGYKSAYTDRINALINEMANRKFSYDINEDAMYDQYKHSYMEQGKQAMQDTMGQAAALTGGYGNSYASSAGNQAYQAYLGKLNDVIPELYQMALDRYNTEGTDKQNLYSMMANQDAQDYAKYRDTVADYQTDRAHYSDQLQNLRTMGQNLWGQNWDNYWNAMTRNDTNYQNAVDTALSLLSQDWSNYHWAQEQTQHNYEQAVSEDQWNAEFAENQRQYNQTYAENQRQYNETLAENQRQFDKTNEYNYYKADLAGSGSSGSSGSSSGGLTQNYSKARNSIVSSREFYNSRRLSNNYQSYRDYVISMIDKNTKLTDAERLQLISDFSSVIYG